MSYKGIVGCATCDQRGELHFSWKVEHFFSLSEEVDDCYDSPEFYFLGRSFSLRLYPSGRSNHESEGRILLLLIQNESCPPMEVECTLGIQAAEGKIEKRKKRTVTFWDKGTNFGAAQYLKRADLLFWMQEFATSDAVTFTVTMKKNGPRSIARTTEAAEERSSEDEDCGEKRLLEKTGCEKVAEDLGKLWSSCDNSDVVVKVGDVEFKAHRAILGARTPVLLVMFNHDTEEKESGVVTITDCQPKIFQEFLHYIYMGSPRELTTENAFGLCAVAEKYLVDDLKTQCLQYIRNTLCVETFCNAVLLALTHRDAELLEQADDFASENIRLIILSVEWQTFLVEHPTEANDILVKALGPHEFLK